MAAETALSQRRARAAGAQLGAAPIRLSALASGAAGIVLRLEPSDPVTERLGDLGFVPGTRVGVVRRAPLGDPILFELRGSQICLRRAEADRIAVRPVGAEVEGGA